MNDYIQQIEINIKELAKSKKRVWVKPTATKKGHYREMEVGRNDGGSSDTKVISDIKRAQSEGDGLREKMNGMIDKYSSGGDISPENQKKIDVIENQMKGAYAERDSLRRRHEGMTRIS